MTYEAVDVIMWIINHLMRRKITMGRSLNVNHIFNMDKLAKAQFKKKFTDFMTAKDYTNIMKCIITGLNTRR